MKLRILTFLLLLSAWPDGALAAPSNRSCKPCHKAQWKQWKQSLHSRAGKNSVFLYEYKAHPGAWCLKCHAPRTRSPDRVLKTANAMNHGVDCITCHLKGDSFLSRMKSPNSPHNTKNDPDFGSPNMCAGCHQFNFPVLDAKGQLLHYTKQPMQNLVAEFNTSPAAATGVECITCHMPTAGGHRFPGAYDARLVTSVLDIQLCKTTSAIGVRIQNTSSAHNLPSGGVNRSIVLRLWDASSPSRKKSYRLERLFDGPVGKRVKRKDTTLAPGAVANWTVPLSLLTSSVPQHLVLDTDFFFGTDPNRNHPTTQRKLSTRTYSYSSIADCASPPANEP